MWGQIAGSAIGAGASIWGQHQANNLQRELLDKQLGFAERMSNTAHQREVEDLRKAGLNPILSAGGGGASTPGVSSPMIQSEMEGAASSARDIGRQIAEVRAIKAGEEKTRMEAKLTEANIVTAKHNARIAAREAARADLVTPFFEMAAKGLSGATNSARDFLRKSKGEPLFFGTPSKRWTMERESARR